MRPRRAQGKPDRLAAVIDGVAARDSGGKRAGGLAEILHACLLGPNERVYGTVRNLRCSNNLAAIIDRSRNREHVAPEVSQIDGRSVLFPKYAISIPD